MCEGAPVRLWQGFWGMSSPNGSESSAIRGVGGSLQVAGHLKAYILGKGKEEKGRVPHWLIMLTVALHKKTRRYRVRSTALLFAIGGLAGKKA